MVDIISKFCSGTSRNLGVNDFSNAGLGIFVAIFNFSVKTSKDLNLLAIILHQIASFQNYTAAPIKTHIPYRLYDSITYIIVL